MTAAPTTFLAVTVSEETATRLKGIARRRRAAARRSEEIEEDMRVAVTQARAEGGNLREIAHLLEVSHTAIAKVERRGRKTGRLKEEE